MILGCSKVSGRAEHSAKRVRERERKGKGKARQGAGNYFEICERPPEEDEES